VKVTYLTKEEEGKELIIASPSLCLWNQGQQWILLACFVVC